jgi:hypothetical protein
MYKLLLALRRRRQQRCACALQIENTSPWFNEAITQSDAGQPDYARTRQLSPKPTAGPVASTLGSRKLQPFSGAQCGEATLDHLVGRLSADRHAAVERVDGRHSWVALDAGVEHRRRSYRLAIIGHVRISSIAVATLSRRQGKNHHKSRCWCPEEDSNLHALQR